MVRVFRAAALLLIILTALCLCAYAEEAVDIAESCTLTVSVNLSSRRRVLEEDYRRYWDGETGDATMTVSTPEGQPAQGIMLGFYQTVPAVRVETEEGKLLAEFSDPFENAWIPFSEPSERFVIRSADGETPLQLNRLYVLSEGELPRWVQRWQVMEGDAELLVVSTHPDDEILWFGGLLPTYAGEMDRRVMVMYMVGGQAAHRKNELLDGLWLMGVHWYPEIGYLSDTSGASIIGTYEAWGGKEVPVERVTEMIRKYRPPVVLTQDVNGEYGHTHHIVTVASVIRAVEECAADPEYAPESAERYGVCQPQKLYIHLWKENQLRFDWRQPLRFADGKTGLELAREAFLKHGSQQRGRHHVQDSGSLDCSLFGLYFTTVGPDEAKDDLFEHVTFPQKEEK